LAGRQSPGDRPELDLNGPAAIDRHTARGLMKKLLLPIDGSPSAQHALEFSIELSRAIPGLSVHLVTAQQPPELYGEVAVYVTKEKIVEFQTHHAEEVLKPAKSQLTAAGVPCTVAVVFGEVADSIVRQAQSEQCDTIVMGTRGMGAIGNLVMGSVATKVVHLAPMPVILVK
jgi:nucleotide-binding universal stress UspA family protein